MVFPYTSQEVPRVQRHPTLFFVLSLLAPCAGSCSLYFSGFQIFLGLALSGEWTTRGTILKDDARMICHRGWQYEFGSSVTRAIHPSSQTRQQIMGALNSLKKGPNGCLTTAVVLPPSHSQFT